MKTSLVRGEKLMEPMLAQVMLFAGNFAPKGWEFCSGQLMPINQNEALFTLLGTTFGGDGKTNFALPDLRSQAPGKGPNGLNYIIAVEGTYPSHHLT
jgi:microcystin-dependent protein